MKLMQYAGARVPGGLLEHLRILATGLAATGHEVSVVIPRATALDPVAGRCEAAGAAVTRLTVEGKTDLPGMAKLGALVSRVTPDVFHLHLSSPIEAVPALVTARCSGARRLVTTEHAPSWYPLERVYSRTVKKAATRALDAVIAVCESDARFLAGRFGVPRDLIRVIHNGVEPVRDLPGRDAARRALGIDPAARFVAGFAGALEESKGVSDLIEACRRCGVEGLVLILAGDGGLRESLERQSTRSGLRLVLPGRLEDIRDLLGALDLFVLPSHAEAMPLSLLEAMSAHLPIVATRVGGIPEAIQDGASGLLVPPRDPSALAEALGRLAADRELSRRLAAAAGVASERFTATRMVRETASLYGSLPASGIVGES